MPQVRHVPEGHLVASQWILQILKLQRNLPGLAHNTSLQSKGQTTALLPWDTRHERETEILSPKCASSRGLASHTSVLQSTHPMQEHMELNRGDFLSLRKKANIQDCWEKRKERNIHEMLQKL